MASVVTVKWEYDDKSASLSLQFNCADSQPSGEVLKSCKDEALQRWTDMGHSIRGIRSSVTVKV